MGFSGRVKNPGLWELPFGTTAREISKTMPAVCVMA
ncbi:NADH-quinone oxidoreductase subunit F [Raoultella terrigena]|uniref:NADH-quinone oxidoreductase subunit F n=1 Tax=Raoultella terrigena TaxID=577 RepID=A0A4U9CYX6_RAOTE|nr:NADH-quinone oxidoreductase subunit F [Raoultella terrigena]